MVSKRDIDWMKDLEATYRRTSGLKSRTRYKIFYSPVRKNLYVILGINPGGDPDTWKPTSQSGASHSYYENGEHDIATAPYSEAAALRPLLEKVLGSSGILQTVKSNLCFRRSQGMDDFKKCHNISLTDGYKECQPYVEKIISRTDPEAIILTGAIEGYFFRHYCCGFEQTGRPIKTNFRGRDTDLFAEYRAEVRCLDRISCRSPALDGRMKPHQNHLTEEERVLLASRSPIGLDPPYRSYLRGELGLQPDQIDQNDLEDSDRWESDRSRISDACFLNHKIVAVTSYFCQIHSHLE